MSLGAVSGGGIQTRLGSLAPQLLGSSLDCWTSHANLMLAHLRTYDDHSTPGSSASSISGFHDPDHEKKDWESEKRNGRIMKIYKKVCWRSRGSKLDV